MQLLESGFRMTTFLWLHPQDAVLDVFKFVR